MVGLAEAQAGAVLRAESYERAKTFYRDVLGLAVEDMPGQMGMVRAGGGTGFMIYERPDMAAPENTTLAFSVADVEAAVADLQQRGVVFEEYDIPEMGLKTVNGIADVNGSKNAWFKDSEGNILSIGKM